MQVKLFVFVCVERLVLQQKLSYKLYLKKRLMLSLSTKLLNVG